MMRMKKDPHLNRTVGAIALLHFVQTYDAFFVSRARHVGGALKVLLGVLPLQGWGALHAACALLVLIGYAVNRSACVAASLWASTSLFAVTTAAYVYAFVVRHDVSLVGVSYTAFTLLVAMAATIRSREVRRV